MQARQNRLLGAIVADVGIVGGSGRSYLSGKKFCARPAGKRFWGSVPIDDAAFGVLG